MEDHGPVQDWHQDVDGYTINLSPAEELAKVSAVMQRNMAAMQAG